MATQEAGRKSSQYIIMCIAPDLCKTPPKGDIIPYQISVKLENAIRYSPNVNFKGEPAAIQSLRCGPVKGNEAGMLGGVKSGVNLGWCRPVNMCENVRVNKLSTLYHENTFCLMNCAGPDGQHNTIGKLYCLDDMLTGPVANPSQPMAGDPLIELTENEKEFLADGAELLDIIADTPGLGVDLAKTLSDHSEESFGVASVLGGLGNLAELSGQSDAVSVSGGADMGLPENVLADTDWNNPRAALAALAASQDSNNRLSNSPQLGQISKTLGELGMGGDTAQTPNSKRGAMMMGVNAISAVRASTLRNKTREKELQVIAAAGMAYKKNAEAAKKIQIASTSLLPKLKARLEKNGRGE